MLRRVSSEEPTVGNTVDRHFLGCHVLTVSGGRSLYAVAVGSTHASDPLSCASLFLGVFREPNKWTNRASLCVLCAFSSSNVQFFVSLGPTPWLDGKHTILGRISSGMKVYMYGCSVLRSICACGKREHD